MRSSASRTRAAAVAALLATLALGGSAVADRIDVAREATVAGGAIQLGDLAVLEGDGRRRSARSASGRRRRPARAARSTATPCSRRSAARPAI